MNKKLEEDDIFDEDEHWEENEKWECYLCAGEEKFSVFPSGYLANYHPLCENCADEIFYNEDHEDRFRLSYHKSFGDLQIIANIPVHRNFFKSN